MKISAIPGAISFLTRPMEQLKYGIFISNLRLYIIA